MITNEILVSSAAMSIVMIAGSIFNIILLATNTFNLYGYLFFINCVMASSFVMFVAQLII